MLIHGDCLEVMRDMEDSSIDLVLTDIPYGVVTDLGADRAKYKGQLRKVDKSYADIVTFDLNVFIAEVDRLCRGSIYIFCAIEDISFIYDYYKNKRKKDYMARLCIWHKSNPSPVNGQHMWLHGSEYIVFAKRRKAVFNENCKSNVFKYPSGSSKIHPTQKPLALFEYLVRASSREGDLVLVPCAGSGTTAVACLNSNRRYICIEKDDKSFNTMKGRVGDTQLSFTNDLFSIKNEDV